MANRRSRSDELIISSLAVGATVEVAAKKAEVSPRTIYRRLKDESFRKRLDEFKMDMLSRVASGFVALTIEAMRTIHQLTLENHPSTVRLGASRSILEFGLKLKELTDIDVRLSKLEEHARISQERLK